MGQRNKFAFDRDTASRKVFPAALATLLVFILSRSALAAPEPARGYSIFQGTMADMTYTELEQAVHSGAIALWGLGVIEEHGPHLPLATDVYMPTAYLREVQRLLAEKKIASVIVPAYYWGVNQVTGSFPGSIDVRPEVMVELMLDVFKSLGRAGFKEVYCITGHGDAAHNRAIVEGVRRGNQSDGIRAYMALPRTLVSRLQLDPKEAHLVIAASRIGQDQPKHPDVHAGDSETSMMWGFYPHVVREKIIPTLKSTDLDIEDLIEWRKGYESATRVTPNGYFGNPAAADPKRGRALVNDEARLLAEAIASSIQSHARH